LRFGAAASRRGLERIHRVRNKLQKYKLQRASKVSCAGGTGWECIRVFRAFARWIKDMDARGQLQLPSTDVERAIRLPGIRQSGNRLGCSVAELIDFIFWNCLVRIDFSFGRPI
jgi:hypothetical protein